MRESNSCTPFFHVGGGIFSICMGGNLRLTWCRESQEIHQNNYSPYMLLQEASIRFKYCESWFLPYAVLILFHKPNLGVLRKARCARRPVIHVRPTSTHRTTDPSKPCSRVVEPSDSSSAGLVRGSSGLIHGSTSAKPNSVLGSASDPSWVAF